MILKKRVCVCVCSWTVSGKPYPSSTTSPLKPTHKHAPIHEHKHTHKHTPITNSPYVRGEVSTCCIGTNCVTASVPTLVKDWVPIAPRGKG